LVGEARQAGEATKNPSPAEAKAMPAGNGAEDEQGAGRAQEGLVAAIALVAVFFLIC
jgi:hypothetical protein